LSKSLRINGLNYCYVADSEGNVIAREMKNKESKTPIFINTFLSSIEKISKLNLGSTETLISFYEENEIVVQMYCDKYILIFVCQDDESLQLLLDLEIQDSINNLYF
jgi:hypothetical protein